MQLIIKTITDMKYFTVTITALLSFTLLFSSCNSNDSAANNNEDSASITPRKTKHRDSLQGGLMIAYYHQDSIAKGFNFYREIDSMLKAKERDFERQLRGKYQSYQEYETKIRQRMDAGEITGYQLEDIQQEAMQKQEAIATFERQRGAELQRESLQYQTALMNKISEAGREFSEINDIDLLFFYQKGGQITYISDAFDATSEFLKFLNKREKEIMSGVEEEMEDAQSEDDVSGLNF